MGKPGEIPGALTSYLLLLLQLKVNSVIPVVEFHLITEESL